MVIIITIMSRKTATLSSTLERILGDLGENIRLARLRRHISTSMLSERAGMTRTTLRSIEKGSGGVTIGAYASVLFCLGLEKDLNLIAKDDILGRKIQDVGLTLRKKRVPRLKAKK
jgi:transcriptional regulator with XRE-family HTH domain